MAPSISDLVIVHIENTPSFFARIEDITPDVKAGWWQVTLLVLTHPPQIFTWILEERQIQGEPFTMGGTPVSIEKVISPVRRESASESRLHPGKDTGNAEKKKGEKIVSLWDRKKKP